MRGWIGRVVVRYHAKLVAVSRVPVFGACVRALGSVLLPKNVLTWTQIETGAGKGLWMQLYPRTAELLVHGSSEPCVQEFILDRLKPGMVFYDLGTNLGFFSLVAARLVGPAGCVYGFEPDPEIAQRVRSNAEHNGFKNFTHVEAAVWRETGTVTFARSDESSSLDRGTGQITTLSEQSRAIAVPSIALDDFAKTARHPDLIKCDVEGAEVEVLRGGTKLLSERHPAIVCEIHSPENGIAVRDQLRRLGYRVFDLDGNHVAAEMIDA